MKSAGSIQGTRSADAVVSRLSMRRARLGYVLVVLAYATLFAFWQVEPVPWHVYAAGVLVVAICLFPIARWYTESSNRMPMFELICLSYALQFGPALFLQPNLFGIVGSPPDGLLHIRRLRWDSTFDAVWMTALGVGVMIIGFYTARQTSMSRVLPHIDLEMDPKRRFWYLASALAVGLPILFIQTLDNSLYGDGSLGAIFRLLANQVYVAIFILGDQFYLGKHRERQMLSFSFYLLVAVVTLLGLVSGSLDSLMLPLVIFFVLRWRAKRKLPWGFLVMGIIAFLTLNSVKLVYRSSAWYSDTTPGLIDRITLWADLSKGIVERLASGDFPEETTKLVAPSIARVDLLHKFAHVVEMTPSVVPYYYGETYSYFLVTWVPRFLWPDKPSASTANRRVDIDYRLLDASNKGTTMGIGQLPEAYANFGVVGILIVMSLQGIIFGALDWILNGSRSEGGRGIYVSVLIWFLTGIGFAASIWFGALLQNVVVNSLILRPFSVGFQAHGGSKKVAQQFSLE